MSFIEIIILAIIQGLTEFLPVSSSGHLAIMQGIFEKAQEIVTQNATLDIMLHFATLFATAIFFRREIIDLVRGSSTRHARSASSLKGSERKTLVLMIVALIPTGIIGLVLNPFFEGMLHNMFLVGIMLGITSIMLFTSRFFASSKNTHDIRITDAVIVGLAQGIAVIPGLSRSGLTIAAALMLGWEREYAFKFSFIISMPAILGATLLEMRNLHVRNVPMLGSYFLGMVIAGVIGYLSLILLRHTVTGRKFHIFSYYCALVACCAIAIAFL